MTGWSGYVHRATHTSGVCTSTEEKGALGLVCDAGGVCVPHR
jgi:hypothetical protein